MPHFRRIPETYVSIITDFYSEQISYNYDREENNDR